ncbi:MAG: putative Alkyldihydroxyacetonephosphate synthase,putative [Gammaproteobacteria bacterium]|nr:putative Alkyldihydroxyacetonephosphate synthase,putative [Gammaproteobacteria bacterium]
MTIIVVILIIVLLLGAILLFSGLLAEQTPEMNYSAADGERYAHKWGYTDTSFDFAGPTTVKVTGKRYPVSGYTMPALIPFVEEKLGVQLQAEDLNTESERRDVPAPVMNSGFLTALQAGLKSNQYSTDTRDRLIHSHGQLSVDEVYRILYGPSLMRLVDLVVYPEQEADVKKIIDAAYQHNICLVPYGGGTNVSGALTCPAKETRTIVSVDMRRMDRILWLDADNKLACVEAGISGKQLELELDKKGYTTGHEPDSIELSTLGGWISTNASGMKKNRYGNIEDIVLEATLVTPTGNIETTGVTPRNATGIQPKTFLFGSEGNFGIITRAVLKIHPQPEVRRYGSLIFPRFEVGVNFLRELRQSGVLPASIRLVNNNEFRFGQALKPAPSYWKAKKDKLQRFFLFHILGFKLTEMVACTIVMEGSKQEVKHQQKVIFGLAKKHQAVSGGATNGKRGYMLTFAIAYIRDFFNKYHVLGETFETSVPWNRIHEVTQGVVNELNNQCMKYQVPGKPYLSYRVTQTYHTGVCIYFTMGIYGKGLAQPDVVFSKIEHALREVILANGGSLSHHHGIGKVRQDFIPRIQSANSIRVLRECKKAMDPNNIFGIRNGVFGE